MGVVDRVVRLFLAAGTVILIGLGVVTGIGAVVLGALGVVLMATALVGYCPIYEPFGIKTCKVVDPAEVMQTQLIETDEQGSCEQEDASSSRMSRSDRNQ